MLVHKKKKRKTGTYILLRAVASQSFVGLIRVRVPQYCVLYESINKSTDGQRGGWRKTRHSFRKRRRFPAKVTKQQKRKKKRNKIIDNPGLHVGYFPHAY